MARYALATVWASTPWAAVNHEHGAFAGRQGPGDFVGEVDMARGINEVELEVLAITLVVDRDGRGLDGDATFTLQVHRIEQLITGLAFRDGVRDLEQAISQRALPMVDVGNDGEVTDGQGWDSIPPGSRLSPVGQPHVARRIRIQLP